MAVPKRRTTRSRRGSRRSHQHLTVPNISYCSHCGTAVLPHRICPNCGYYHGLEVVQPKSEEK